MPTLLVVKLKGKALVTLVISWDIHLFHGISKKQNLVALSTTETEYIAIGLCCVQILWIKQTISDFDLSFEHILIKCDNTSAI